MDSLNILRRHPERDEVSRELHEFRADDIEKADAVLRDLCSNMGDNFRMCIPVQRDDSDMVLSRVIAYAAHFARAAAISEPSPWSPKNMDLETVMTRVVFNAVNGAKGMPLLWSEAQDLVLAALKTVKENGQ